MSGDRFQGFAFDAAALAEPGDLDLERRREILFTEARLDALTHYEILGIPWNSGPEAARAAYVERVKVFHPDRYPGKALGSYRARMERVFRRLTEARDTLVDPARRTAYARETAPALEATRLAARELEEGRRAQERRARVNRQNPLLARAVRVTELMRHGREAMAAGLFQQAATDFGLAASLDPEQAEAGPLAVEARRRSVTSRVAEILERAATEEAQGNWARALAAYRAALEIDPGSLHAALLASAAAIQAGDPAAACALGRDAVRIEPRSGRAHEALGTALEAAGQRADARRELERALELDPRLEGARERLRRMRWRFLG